MSELSGFVFVLPILFGDGKLGNAENRCVATMSIHCPNNNCMHRNADGVGFVSYVVRPYSVMLVCYAAKPGCVSV